ncbi:thiamine pyrophosphate-dependent enzyme, partial [Kitasatospora phosalacinea]
VQAEFDAGHRGDYTEWWKRLNEWKQTYPLGYEPAPDGQLSPQQVIERIGQLVGPDAIYAAGVGQHQMWASQFIQFEKPATWLNSGGAGTMGYAVPAAMGAKAGRPDVPVWAIDGDGCFQMTNQELTTCTLNNIPIKVAVINNGSLGMVRQWQTLFYNQRYSHTVLHSGPTADDSGSAAGDGTGPAAWRGTRVPDFVLLSEAMGAVGLRCERPEDLDDVIKQAMEINDRPVVIDFIVHQDAMVWPMVAAGTSNDEIQFARGVRPDFGDDLD